MAIPAEFLRICRANSTSIDAATADLLERYVDLLLGWNSRINLISRRDEENVWFAHILHSVSPWFLLEIPRDRKLIDLGSGGGLPGIPLAILRPDLRIALLDSIRKKTLALESMVGELALGNVNIVTGRAEDVCHWEGFACAFDLVISRAVAPLKDPARWSRPFLVRGTHSGAVPASPALRHRRLLAIPSLVALKGGITHPGYIHELPLEKFESLMQVNYFGTVYVTKSVLPGMIERGSGHIINISSMAGYVGVFGCSAYSASKFAVTGFSESLRAEMKPHGIRVAVAFPPDTDTPQLAYEEPFKPAETKAISGTPKALSAESVARSILKQAETGNFLIFPGFDSRLFYLLTTKLPKWLVLSVVDQIAASGSRSKK